MPAGAELDADDEYVLGSPAAPRHSALAVEGWASHPESNGNTNAGNIATAAAGRRPRDLTGMPGLGLRDVPGLGLRERRRSRARLCDPCGELALVDPFTEYLCRRLSNSRLSNSISPHRL